MRSGFEIVNRGSVTVRRSKTMDRNADKYVVNTVKHSPSRDDVGLFQLQKAKEACMPCPRTRVADPDLH